MSALCWFLFVFLWVKVDGITSSQKAARMIGAWLSVSSLTPALATPPPRASIMVKEGMESFRKGDVAESLDRFNSAIEQVPEMKPYLWQRGLSLYYTDSFSECANQFKIDVQANPRDTEESLWNKICRARELERDVNEGQKFVNLQLLDTQGEDPRPVMSVVRKMFQGEMSPEKVLEFGENSGIGSSEYFYGLLYISLYYEAHGATAQSLQYMMKAVASPYAGESNDYMVSLAKVHLGLRQKAEKM
jgi:lipoprotein NlpI